MSPYQFYLIPHDLGYDGPRDNLSEAGLQKILANSVSDRDLEKLFEGIDAGRLVIFGGHGSPLRKLERDKELHDNVQLRESSIGAKSKIIFLLWEWRTLRLINKKVINRNYS